MRLYSEMSNAELRERRENLHYDAIDAQHDARNTHYYARELADEVAKIDALLAERGVKP